MARRTWGLDRVTLAWAQQVSAEHRSMRDRGMVPSTDADGRTTWAPAGVDADMAARCARALGLPVAQVDHARVASWTMARASMERVASRRRGPRKG